MGHSTVASYRPTKVGTVRAREAPRTLPQPSWLLLIVITATVAGLVWGLMQQRRPQIDPRQVIAINLAAGELAFKHARYVEPVEHSAAHYFRAVLALDPNHPRALRGLREISKQFAEQTKIAILDARFAEAAMAIEQLRRVGTDDRRLGLLEIELRKALDAHVATLAALSAKPSETSTNALRPAEPVVHSAPTRTVDRNAANSVDAVPMHTQASIESVRPDPDSIDAVNSQPRIATTSAAASAEPRIASAAPSVGRPFGDTQRALAPIAAESALRADQAQTQPRMGESGATAAISDPPPARPEQPLPTPAAQMAATTPSPAPIEVSARWLPTAINLVEPRYPQAAQVRGIEGWVDLMLTVAPTGEVIDAQVRDREGSRSFERAALLAVRQWRYEPNAAGSSAPALDIPVRVAFKLE